MSDTPNHTLHEEDSDGDVVMPDDFLNTLSPASSLGDLQRASQAPTARLAPAFDAALGGIDAAVQQFENDDLGNMEQPLHASQAPTAPVPPAAEKTNADAPASYRSQDIFSFPEQPPQSEQLAQNAGSSPEADVPPTLRL